MAQNSDADFQAINLLRDILRFYISTENLRIGDEAAFYLAERAYNNILQSDLDRLNYYHPYEPFFWRAIPPALRRRRRLTRRDGTQDLVHLGLLVAFETVPAFLERIEDAGFRPDLVSGADASRVIEAIAARRLPCVYPWCTKRLDIYRDET